MPTATVTKRAPLLLVASPVVADVDGLAAAELDEPAELDDELDGPGTAFSITPPATEGGLTVVALLEPDW